MFQDNNFISRMMNAPVLVYIKQHFYRTMTIVLDDLPYRAIVPVALYSYC